MSDKKQIPGLPVATEAKDNDRLIKRDTDSGSDEGLPVSVLLERSAEQVDEHAAETGGVHGIPAGERAIHSEEVLAAVTTAANVDEAISFVGRGAIVESGTNANGSFVRWENGEQLVFSQISDVDIDNNRNSGSYFQSSPVAIPQPASFEVLYALSVSADSSNIWGTSNREGTTATLFFQSEILSRNANIVIWGKWK